jgi:hypothetical protein
VLNPENKRRENGEESCGWRARGLAAANAFRVRRRIVFTWSLMNY